MKAFFVLCHQSSKLHGEVREAIVARELRTLGIDARLFRPWGGNTDLSNMFEDIVPVTFCPLDQPTADVHENISTPLIERVAAERPDLVIFKGPDYALVDALVERLDPSSTRIAFVIGGVAVHPALKSACLVLTESEQQTQAIYDFLGRRIPIRILSKYINWKVADEAYAAAQATDDKKYDIVNVGYFEDRKNQIELRRFFGKRSVAIVGHGPTLEATKEAATGYEGVTFFGDLPNESALRVMSQARLMVHTSLWEGLPRAIIESLGCGTPVVAFDFAIQSRLGNSHVIRLVPREDLETAVDGLLADPAGLKMLSDEARQVALASHGPARLKEAAVYIRDFLNGEVRE